MNIFILDLDPKKCAKYTCDKHVVKMILESAQMLSTACRISGINEGYKSSYINHPCNIWVRDSLENWKWLRSLVIELNKEWQKRFNHKRNHKSFEVAISLSNPKIRNKELTSFVQAMPNIYKNIDTVQAYRDYYMGEKRHIAYWTNGQPWWWK